MAGQAASLAARLRQLLQMRCLAGHLADPDIRTILLLTLMRLMDCRPCFNGVDDALHAIQLLSAGLSSTSHTSHLGWPAVGRWSSSRSAFLQSGALKARPGAKLLQLIARRLPGPRRCQAHVEGRCSCRQPTQKVRTSQPGRGPSSILRQRFVSAPEQKLRRQTQSCGRRKPSGVARSG